MYKRDIVERKSVVTTFRIFYGDGNTVSGDSVEDWNSAPIENVQLIMLYTDQTCPEDGSPLRASICGWDYYSFDGKEFRASNDTRELSGKIKYGLWIDTREWKEIARKALEEYVTPEGERVDERPTLRQVQEFYENPPIVGGPGGEIVPATLIEEMRKPDAR